MMGTTEGKDDVVIQVRDLAYATPDGRPLIRGLSFAIRRGEIGVVTGPNGLGKSTLLKILLGMQKATGGQVSLDRSQGPLAYLPQTQNRAFHMPLLLSDVVGFGRDRRRGPEWDRDLAEINLLTPEQLGLTWNRASGGERQKALLTMTLLHPGDLIFLDEPLNHLDAQGQAQLGAALAAATQGKGKTILMVSHRPPLLSPRTVPLVEIPLQHVAVGGSV